MMPGMSGTDLARRIRDNKALSEIRLVLVSSAGNYGTTPQALQLVDAKIDKPVRQHELRDCLVRLYTGEDAVTEVAVAEETDAGKAPQILTPTDVPLRILMAEDNKINQKYALALLERRHHLTIAENGVQAVEAMRRSELDVVLMDIQMPELDGIGATRQIRALPAPKCDVPIVAMTANAQLGAREPYLAAGMNDYVAKPISPAAVLSLLVRFGPSAERQVADPLLAEAQPAATPLLDKLAIETLGQAIGQEQLAELLALFVQDSREHLEAIADGRIASDMAVVARSAHSLISSAANVGALRMSTLSRTIQAAAQNDDRAAVTRVSRELVDAHTATVAAISPMIEALSPAAADSRQDEVVLTAR